MDKKEYLKRTVKHIDIKRFNSIPIIEFYEDMAFQARNLARASQIYHRMLGEDCTIILCLAGSLFSAGLKNVVYDMLMHNMVDVIVSTGAIIVDQDFFEALGYNHYVGTPFADDDELRQNHIDRIYDTYIDEDELRECDLTVAKIADSLKKRPYSSREFIYEMGRYLQTNAENKESVVYASYMIDVPIFVPAFSDCSAGFGLVYHRANNPEDFVSIDSAADFKEITEIKIKAGDTGLLMVGGGVPKNFAQDTVVAADILGADAPMHKYAVQITVADERDGALSGSTLKEANSWGKVDQGFEQMVFSEATISFPLLASYAYHKGNWKNRQPKKWNKIF